MKTLRLQSWIRLVLILCGIGLIAVLFFPMWKIELQAPQYPEGLRLLIYPNKLGGDVDIINGLNHYIGMKTLHVNDFIEFTVLPYIISFFATLFILVAVVGKRKLLNFLLILFVVFGIVAMYDFWRWEYNYGHNLNPDAAIIVPGMAYQPPLIGFKQLLNFGAYSIPDIGGWIFISSGILLFLCVIAAWKQNRLHLNKAGELITAMFLSVVFLSSCKTGLEPIQLGVDHCYFCKMTVSDNRFGAELITKKGKVYKFDDMHCILSYLKAAEISKSDINEIYFVDFAATHQLINLKKSFLLKSDAFKSPMGGNIAAFNNNDSLMVMQKVYPGIIVGQNELIQ